MRVFSLQCMTCRACSQQKQLLAARLSQGHHPVSAHAHTGEVKDGDGITAAVTTALFEALSYPHLLEDAEVMAGLVDTLLHINQWCD